MLYSAVESYVIKENDKARTVASQPAIEVQPCHNAAPHRGSSVNVTTAGCLFLCPFSLIGDRTVTILQRKRKGRRDRA